MTKRFFRCNDHGVTYTFVATDLAAAMRLIIDAGCDFGADIAPDVGYEITWHEISAETAKGMYVHHDTEGPPFLPDPAEQPERVALFTCPLGAWFCSEW